VQPVERFQPGELPLGPTRSPVLILNDGLPIGNKQFSGYRRGADFRIATYATLEVFPYPTTSPTAESRAIAAFNAEWGHPQHWLHIPEFSLSLWWPFVLSGVLPGIWLARRRQRDAPGFPVVVGRRAT
jgi:hypothetical protein